MKNEDRIVELLSEMVAKQDVFVSELREVKGKQDVFVDELREVKKIQQRQENHLIKMLEILADDVPRFDEVIEIEHLDNKDQIILRKHK